MSVNKTSKKRAAKGGGMENNMSVLKVNKDNFDQVLNSEKKVLLDFYADWCGPCRMLSPIVDEVAEEREDILVAKVNVDDEQELAQQYGVISIPTLVVLEGGKVLHQSSGARPKTEVLKLLEG